MAAHGRDQGSVVVGWLLKLVVMIGVVAVVLFDTVSIMAARLGAEDDASTAASAAGAAWQQTHNVQAAYQAAIEALPSQTEKIPTKTFVIESDGTVRLVLRKPVTTLVAQHIGALKKYDVAVVTGEAPPSTP
jgi:hypothetical protein